MDIVIPKSEQTGGGGGDYWKRTKKKHTLRFFAFPHDDKMHLSIRQVIHFVNDVPSDCTGDGCVICKEAKETKNKRLRPSERFKILIVDMDGDKDATQPYDCPTSVYQKLIAQIEDAGDADGIIGNDGIDFTLTYDEAAQPSSKYALLPKIKGSEELEIDDDDLPDLYDMGGGSDSKEEAGGETDPDGEDACTFTNTKGEEVTGELTGAKKGKKHQVEVDGRLQYVAVDAIIKCESLDIDNAGEEEAEPAKGKKKKKAKKEEPKDFEVGDDVKFTDDEGDELEGKITKIKGKKITVETDEYEFDLKADDITAA